MNGFDQVNRIKELEDQIRDRIDNSDSVDTGLAEMRVMDNRRNMR